MIDTIDFVRDIIKQRSDSRTPMERQVVDLLRTMIHARLTEHPAFDALYQLYGYLTVPGELECELRQHRTWEGELVDGIDMAAADKHYRHWCKLRGVADVVHRADRGGQDVGREIGIVVVDLADFADQLHAVEADVVEAADERRNERSARLGREQRLRRREA